MSEAIVDELNMKFPSARLQMMMTKYPTLYVMTASMSKYANVRFAAYMTLYSACAVVLPRNLHNTNAFVPQDVTLPYADSQVGKSHWISLRSRTERLYA